MPRPRIFARRVPLVLSVLLLATLLTGTALWKANLLKPWIQARVVEFYARKIQPSLPFRIESARVDAGWREFLKGRIHGLELRIRWRQFRLSLNGPIEIHSAKGAYVLSYQPEIRALEPVSASLPANAKFDLDVPASLDRLDSIALDLNAPALLPPLFPGLELRGISAQAEWNAQSSGLSLQARLGELGWESPEGRSARAQGLALRAQGSWQWSPARLAPGLSARLSADGVEILDGETYLDLPSRGLPIELRLEDESVEVRAPHLEARVSAQGAQWKLQDIDLPRTLAALLAATSSSGGLLGAWTAPLRGIQAYKGTIRSSGKLRWGSASERPEYNGSFEIHDATIGSHRHAALASGVRLRLTRINSREGVAGSVRAEALAVRRLRGSLGETPLRWNPDGRIEIGEGARLPLRVDSLTKADVTPIRGKMGRAYELSTALDLEIPRIDELASRLCVKGRIPPGSAQARFPRIEFSPGVIDPEGETRLELFGGRLRVSEIGIFDLSSPVPEVDFTAELEDVRLDQLGAWMNFGEMDGVLNAHARDVVFQSWLPTQYDFRIEAAPARGKRDIVFSPEAMRNVATLVSGHDFSEVPRFAKWLVFGWPSRVFGGYDVDYAGFSLFSREGLILLETLDPPDPYNPKNPLSEHYILKGTRFKIPLKSRRYPFIVDATAMSNYARTLFATLDRIARPKNPIPKNPGEDPTHATRPESETDCDPGSPERVRLLLRDGERELPGKRRSASHR